MSAIAGVLHVKPGDLIVADEAEEISTRMFAADEELSNYHQQQAGNGSRERIMMQIPLRILQAVLIAWIVAVGVAYLTGVTPVYGLIGIIVTTISK